MTTAPAFHPPIPPGARRAILFGGSFDPVHRGHVALPARVREHVGADLVVYIPAARSPFKRSSPTASGDERVEMLRLALEPEPALSGRWTVCDAELRRSRDAPTEPSYTVETLESLAADGPLAGLERRLLIGADQAASFHRWKSASRIVELAEPVVMLRTPAEDAEPLIAELAEHWPASEVARWRERIVPTPTIDVSATQVRDRLARDPRDPGLDELVPPAALAFIRERGLYSGSPDGGDSSETSGSPPSA